MSGRAGRKGFTSIGESIVICRPSELNAVLRMIDPTTSFPFTSDSHDHSRISPSSTMFAISPTTTQLTVLSKDNAIQRLLLVSVESIDGVVNLDFSVT